MRYKNDKYSEENYNSLLFFAVTIGILFLISGIIFQYNTPMIELSKNFWKNEIPIMIDFLFSIFCLHFFIINIIEDRKYNKVLDLCLMDGIIQEILMKGDNIPSVSEKFINFALKARVDELNDYDQKYRNNSSFVKDLIKKHDKNVIEKDKELLKEKELQDDLKIKNSALEFVKNIKENKIG